MSHAIAIENLNIEELRFILNKEPSTQLIDVREIDEHLRFNIGGRKYSIVKNREKFS